jgi:hypothetical protein
MVTIGISRLAGKVIFAMPRIGGLGVALARRVSRPLAILLTVGCFASVSCALAQQAPPFQQDMLNHIRGASVAPVPSVTCGAGFTFCLTGGGLGVCTNTQVDPNHCGNCSSVCPGTQACTAGVCTGTRGPAMTVTGGSFSTSGRQGGPLFNPKSVQYTVAAASGTVNWSVTYNPTWLTPSATSGTAGTGGTTVTFTVNSAADSFSLGHVSDEISFFNASGGDGTQAISVSLNVVSRAAHDFNGDGKSDIAWRDTSGNIAIWEMNGTTVTNQNSAFVNNVPTQWAIVGQRDFNGDGFSDLLWRDSSGNVAMWLMNGTAILANSPLIANVPINWSIFGTGDFNGDGKADILWQDTSGNVAIWLMNGTTILNQNSSYVSTVPGQWSIAGAGDFNGDGMSDILWQDTSGNVAVWLMNGTAVLATAFVANVPGQWSIKGTGDFNGDGKADILWHDSTGNVAIWEMNGTTVLNQNSSFVGNVPSQWSIQLTGDFNADGMSDILWQDASGNVAIWEMNGTTVLNQNSSFVANVAGPWSIQNLAAD